MLVGRRQFTKSLAACTAAYWVKPLPLPDDLTTQLQVFFHGLWAFVVGSGSITAITTSICEHCYVAGRLADQPLPFDPGNITLAGVNNGSGFFDDQRNLILPLPSKVNLNAFRNRIFLKTMPDSIDSRRQAKIKFNFGTKTLSMVQALTYTVADPAVPPVFTNIPWRAQGAVANIHFYAEPGNNVGDVHARMALADLTAHLNLSSVSLKQIVSSSNPVTLGDFTLKERGITNCRTDCLPDGSVAKEIKTPKHTISHKPHNQKEPDKGPDVANCMSIILTT